jgi:nuclear pore complex protein Nup205
LLLSVIRVIVSAVFIRGIHNEHILEQTRVFLTENRQNMVGVFKRYAKVGGAPATDNQETLYNLVKSYTALIVAVNFTEVSVSFSVFPICMLNLQQIEDIELRQKSGLKVFS